MAKNAPDIRDIPSSWDYNLILILASIFVGIAIILAYSQIQYIKDQEENEGGQTPITNITMPDGQTNVTENDIITSGITDIVDVKLTPSEIAQYKQIQAYLYNKTDVKLPIETQAPYLKYSEKPDDDASVPEEDRTYMVMAGFRDFEAFKKHYKTNPVDNPPDFLVK